MLLIVKARHSRALAKEILRAEVCAVFERYSPKALQGGPLGDRPHMHWFELDAGPQDPRIPLLASHLGYAECVWRLLPIPEDDWRRGQPALVRWRKEPYRLDLIYKLDRDVEKQRDPDRRLFLLVDSSGQVREVRGYRGDGQPSSRRALPVCDARVLVNLARPRQGGTLWDPFAGIGGVILEAKLLDIRTLSVDIDPRVAPGLSQIADRHMVADSTSMELESESIDCVATELPFHKGSEELFEPLSRQLAHILSVGGYVSILAAEWQGTLLRESLERYLVVHMDASLDRKGSSCRLLCARRVH